jgi:hypothetical protein
VAHGVLLSVVSPDKASFPAVRILEPDYRPAAMAYSFYRDYKTLLQYKNAIERRRNSPPTENDIRERHDLITLIDTAVTRELLGIIIYFSGKEKGKLIV